MPIRPYAWQENTDSYTITFSVFSDVSVNNLAQSEKLQRHADKPCRWKMRLLSLFYLFYPLGLCSMHVTDLTRLQSLEASLMSVILFPTTINSFESQTLQYALALLIFTLCWLESYISNLNKFLWEPRDKESCLCITFFQVKTNWRLSISIDLSSHSQAHYLWVIGESDASVSISSL